MKTCGLCSTELKFMNTPILGAGKTKDDQVLCSKCYMKVSTVVNIKKHTLAEIQHLFEKHMIDKNEQKTKAEENKQAAIAEKAAKAEEKKQADMITQAEKREKDALIKKEAEAQKESRRKQKLEEMKAIMDERAAENDKKKLRLEEIKATIQNLKLDGASGFLGRKEINELPNILSKDEHLDNIIQGVYNEGQGILVSTDRRLIFIDKGLLFGLKVEDFPLDKITSIQYETGLMFGKVTIHTSANIAVIDQVIKSQARGFAEFVRNKLSQPKQPQVVQQVVEVAPQADILGQLEKLAQLKEKGILSEDEFLEQKKKLLEKL